MKFKRLFLFPSPIFYFILAMILYGFTIATRVFDNDFGWSIRSLGLVANLIIFSAYGYHIFFKKKPFEFTTFINLIILGGFFLRLSYAFTTGPFLRQHDVDQINLLSTGHYGYILTLIRTGSLPLINDYQFYHPPLYHAISAIWLKGIEFIFSPVNLVNWFDTLSILSLIISHLTLEIGNKIIKLLKLKNSSYVIFLLLITYHPIFILMAGRHNNDPLSYLWLFLIFYLFIRWWKTKQAVILYAMAISIGLGMLTKASVALITPMIGIMMVYVLFVEKKQRQRRLFEYIMFMLIVFPLGLSFIIRNYVMFGQSPTFVWEITNPALSTSQYQWFQRFLPFEWSSFLSRVYPSAGEDYNIWTYLTKTSIFGEFNYWGGHLYSVILLIVNTFLVYLFTLITMTYLFKKIKLWTGLDFLFIGYGFLLFASYIIFNLNYPYGPTMDFRYLLGLIIVIGYLTTHHPFIEQYQSQISAILLIFSASSVLFFTFLF
jgi:4-amino-4-deoxy-L-arabinose transferase-like glycosyltransferase